MSKKLPMQYFKVQNPKHKIQNNIRAQIINSGINKQFAILVDPDKVTRDVIISLVNEAKTAAVDYFFVGGSLLVNQKLDESTHMIILLGQIGLI